MKYSAKVYKETSDFKSIIESVTTGTKSSDEVLKTLDKIGIESYVTEEGDLMIRYWQVGAENFVSPEQAAIIRAGRPSPEQSDELDWLSKNLQNIRNKYGGQWVAIYNNEIVASALNLPELMNQITKFDRPLITFIPSEPIVWTFTYAG